MLDRLRGAVLDLAVVGLGKAANTIHLPAITGSSRSRLASVWDTDQDAIKRVTDRYPGVEPASSLDDICNSQAIGAVVVATPPDSHREIGLSLIEAGKPILMEKPLAPTYAESVELVSSAASAGVPLAVGHMKRFHPTLRLVRTLIAEGHIGKPFFIGAHWAADVKLNPEELIPPGFENYWWRWQDTGIGGGIGQDHIPHYVDLARHWTGAEPARVLGHNMNVALDHLEWPAHESVWEDMSVVLIELDSRCLLRLETGVVGRSISPLLGTGHGLGEWTEYAFVLGTRGKIIVDLPPWDASETGRVALWTAENPGNTHRGWTLIEQPEPRRIQGSPSGTAFETFLRQHEAFLNWITDPELDPGDLATAHDGATSVAVVEAVYKSASLGRWLKLQEVTTEGINLA